MPQTKGTVLVLGAGLVCPPGVEYLCSHGYKVIVASRTLAAAEKITRKSENAEARELDIEKPSGVALLEELVPQVDAVLSLLPYLYHSVAAECALKNKKHFFTTSYVSDAMRKVVEQNKDVPVCILNECGVDPGTDHMSAKRVIDSVHQKGGKIISFTSYCGGLPAPDANDNPFGYKLSWAPRGVLLASRNSATFLKNGELVTIPGEVLFDNYSVEEIPSLGKFEAYPNRNSTQYIEIYNIPETKTIIRGTYRNIGWCPTIKKLAELGYLGLENQDFSGLTYAQSTSRLLNIDANSNAENITSAIAQKLGIAADDFRIKNMEWLGLFGNNNIPANTNTYLDVLCSLCVEKLQYKSGERDLLLMKHTFIAEYVLTKISLSDILQADRRETLTTTLIDYGIPNGHSSMSRTVTLPVAIAIRLVLEGKVTLTGLQMPVIPEWYNPILDELETLGIKFHDEVVSVEKL